MFCRWKNVWRTKSANTRLNGKVLVSLVFVMGSLENDQCKHREFKLLVREALNHFDELQHQTFSVTRRNTPITLREPATTEVTFGLIQSAWTGRETYLGWSGFWWHSPPSHVLLPVFCHIVFQEWWMELPTAWLQTSPGWGPWEQLIPTAMPAMTLRMMKTVSAVRTHSRRSIHWFFINIYLESLTPLSQWPSKCFWRSLYLCVSHHLCPAA